MIVSVSTGFALRPENDAGMPYGLSAAVGGRARGCELL